MSHQIPEIMTVRDSAIWYQCDVGFSPVSGEDTPQAAKISCDNGHIKPAVPACLKTCSLPEINGQYEGDVSSLKHGTNTTYKCSTSASTDDRILVQCNNGTLFPEQPACEQPACNSAVTCFDQAEQCYSTDARQKSFWRTGKSGCREKCFSYSEFTCNSALYNYYDNYCLLFDKWPSEILCEHNSSATYLWKYTLFQRKVFQGNFP
jgi:hypothetical protein